MHLLYANIHLCLDGDLRSLELMIGPLDSIQSWLKSWNLVILAKWYWLKVTRSGEPITSFQHPHKKPFEILIIAGRQSSPISRKNSENPVTFENEHIIVSVPSGINSHKPPLLPILRQIGIISENDQCLELFGRYLLPNCVTIGNQCLLFQDIGLFYTSTSHTTTK